jgi:hypothetical protein
VVVVVAVLDITVQDSPIKILLETMVPITVVLDKAKVEMVELVEAVEAAITVELVAQYVAVTMGPTQVKTVLH